MGSRIEGSACGEACQAGMIDRKGCFIVSGFVVGAAPSQFGQSHHETGRCEAQGGEPSDRSFHLIMPKPGRTSACVVSPPHMLVETGLA
jgi:hypothetical protein